MEFKISEDIDIEEAKRLINSEPPLNRSEEPFKKQVYLILHFVFKIVNCS